MTITFFSNFLNDHQLPFCEEMIKHLGESNFHFVACTQMDLDRIEMGFEDMNVTKEFVVRAYESIENFNIAQKLLDESDVAIIGSMEGLSMKKRHATGKLTFQYNERFLKTGDIRILDPRLFIPIWRDYTFQQNNNVYTLCASAYTSRDLSKFGYPRTNCYKWGYFPRNRIYDDIDELLEGKKTGLKHPQGVPILWVGRLIGLKHPEHAIYVAKRLKDDRVRFTLDIIGTGDMYNEIDEMIKMSDLADCVRLLGSMKPDQVREYMEKAQIFLFTSDKNEGWGAVLNESMNSACAVIANRAIGSVPFLISHQKNGLIYKTTEELYQNVKFLVDNPDCRESIGKNAYKTILTKWNAKDATVRLLHLIQSINKGERDVYTEGPCSLA